MGESREQRLSELMDDELSELERRRWLDELIGDEANRATLGRYRLIGEVLRQEGDSPLVRPDFSARVMAAIQENGAQGVVQSSVSNWKRALSGLAIAASVAMMAVYLAPAVIDPAVEGVTPIQVAAVSQAASSQLHYPSKPESSEGTYWETLPPEVENKLNRYLVDHAEYASGRAMDGMLPYASFVSYDRNR